MIDKKQSPESSLHELVSLYAAGVLDSEDRFRFEQHLQRGCPACETELRSFHDVTAALGETRLVQPPAHVRERLLKNIASSPRTPGALFQQHGIMISRSDEIVWQVVAPGIEMKMLHIDEDRKLQTCIVKMDAGATYPRHRHADVEEIFVLSGEIEVDGQTARVGDYCRAGSDTVHGETSTTTGALFLLIASPDNELLL